MVVDRGQEHFSEATKGEVPNDYFKNQFQTANNRFFTDLFEGFTSRVIPGRNEMLSTEVRNEKLRDAMFSIKASSVPGPDEMTGLFFQKYWETIGGQVTTEVSRNYLSQGPFQRIGTILTCAYFQR